MYMSYAKKTLRFVVPLFSMSMIFGCAGMEYNTKQDKYPYIYIHKELQEADRAVETARKNGKDTKCPVEFKAAKDLEEKAYAVYAACHTQEGIDLARKATAKAQALCPSQPETQPTVQEAPLEPIPAAEPSPERMKYCVNLDIEFDINKADIRPQYHDQVAKVGDFMKRNSTTTATIEGYADEVGNDEDNMRLSQQRAESVVKYLVDTFGIEPSRLAAKGYGKTRPSFDNSTDAGRQKNRRIVAIIDCALDVKELAVPPERLCMTLQMEFASGASEINPLYYNQVNKVGEYMKKYPTTTAVIEGHTDNVGGLESNMELSRQRAENVVNYLVANFGIERTRLAAKGYGPTRRIAYNNTPEGRQKNRRINAVIDCVINK
ncbi:MAG: OmpA family protein [Desulfuromonadales bacterium]|nr:OmpA family protein [Desulfuromonadales bacterium]